VPLFDAEVPGQPAAPAEELGVTPALASSSLSAALPKIDDWWQCGWTSASTPDRSGSSAPMLSRYWARVCTRSATLAEASSAMSLAESSLIVAMQEGSTPTIGTSPVASRAVIVSDRFARAASS
jgi:hypothetical protein